MAKKVIYETPGGRQFTDQRLEKLWEKLEEIDAQLISIGIDANARATLMKSFVSNGDFWKLRINAVLNAASKIRIADPTFDFPTAIDEGISVATSGLQPTPAPVAQYQQPTTQPAQPAQPVQPVAQQSQEVAAYQPPFRQPDTQRPTRIRDTFDHRTGFNAAGEDVATLLNFRDNRQSPIDWGRVAEYEQFGELVTDDKTGERLSIAAEVPGDDLETYRHMFNSALSQGMNFAMQQQHEQEQHRQQHQPKIYTAQPIPTGPSPAQILSQVV